ncbi:MAG: winged helix-turn-helix transcriptional regulator [Dehalococcoidia bacterium]
MSRVPFAEMSCSIARALDVVGERWTLLVVREAFGGTRRFEDFLERLPIARNVLAERLATLVAHGVLERRPYHERPERYEYGLTERGMDLYPVLIALMHWGEEHTPPGLRPSTRIVHGDCGHGVRAAIECLACERLVSPGETRGLPGFALATARVEP